MTRDVRILNTGSLLELSRRLRAAGGENIRQSMHRRIRRAAEPLRDDLQSTMRGLDIRSQGRRTRPGGPSPNTRPLRETLAAAIRISVRTGNAMGATVWIDKGRLPRDLWGVPGQLNDGRLRHPRSATSPAAAGSTSTPRRPGGTPPSADTAPAWNRRWPASSTTCGAASNRSTP